MVALAACGTAAPPVHPGEQYLASIRIEGNHAIESDTLISGLILNRRLQNPTRRRPIDEYQLATDVERVVGEYQKRGYLAVDVRSRVEHHGPEETAVITVVEGPRAQLRVEISGLPPEVPLATARKLIPRADGEPFDYDVYDDAKGPLQRLVEDAGYAHAELEASVIADRAHQLALARYVIDPGPPCKFGSVEIAGADGALAEAVRARVAIHPGDPFSATAVASTQQALYAMKRFSTVRVDVDRNTQDPVIAVKIGLTEGTHNEFSAGGGLGLDPINYAVRARATYTRTGWPFPLSTVGVDFRPAYTFLRETCEGWEIWNCPRDPRVRLLGTLSQQDFLFRDVRADVEAGADFLTIEAYTIEGVHAKFSVSTPLGTPRLVVRAGWLLAGNEFTDLQIDPATAQRIGVNHFERLGAFNQALVIDLRDHPIEPRYGGYAELKFAEGTELAGGAYRYFQITPDIRGYAPLGPLELAAHARLGKIFGDVPPTERYYAGGASSHRGFPERQLSPVGMTTAGGEVVIGGSALLETGLELRAPLGSPKGLDLGAVAFLDGGDVTDREADLSIDHLQWAAGLGFRWFLLPVGPVRFDFAYRLGQDDPDLPKLGRFQWFFSIGEAY